MPKPGLAINPVPISFADIVKIIRLPFRRREIKPAFFIDCSVQSSGTWNRTKIHGFKGRCPAFRRSPNAEQNGKSIAFRPKKINGNEKTDGGESARAVGQVFRLA